MAMARKADDISRDAILFFFIERITSFIFLSLNWSKCNHKMPQKGLPMLKSIFHPSLKLCAKETSHYDDCIVSNVA
jgi:hypothetical protein